MKMYMGNTPMKSLNIRHFEMDTNDATLQASDLQSGVTAYARGQKIVGTGRAFSFATYGTMSTNLPRYVPMNINVVEIASADYPMKLELRFNKITETDFTTAQKIAVISIDGVEYDVNIMCQSNILKITCDKTVDLEVFYGKDEYI